VIDEEVRRFVTEQYNRDQKLLSAHQSALKILAQELLTQETVTGRAVREALENHQGVGSPAPDSHLQGTLV